MPPQPRHDLARVRGQRRDELRIVGRHALGPRARLDELLPDEDAEPVAEVVELVALDQAAAPHAQQVGVRARGERQQALELLRPRHAVEHVERHPVPAADRHLHTVDTEAVIVELDRPEADGEVTRGVETLLAHAVRPPELRRLDAEQRLPLGFDGADTVAQRDGRKALARRIERDGAPDALVDQPRAEVPAVAHAALVHADSARPAHLRLALGRRVHGDREQVLVLGDLDTEGRKSADVMRDLGAVDEHRRLMVGARELDRPAVHSCPVYPRALGHPLREAAVALEVRIGHLARAHEVVDDAARHARRQPARCVPRLVHVPAPLLAEPALELPAGHSSRSVSRTPSPSTTNVLISFAPKSASITRPRISKRAREARPALSYARTTKPLPFSAPLTAVTTTSAPPSSPCESRCGNGPSWNASMRPNAGWLSSIARRTTSASRRSPACGIRRTLN